MNLFFNICTILLSLALQFTVFQTPFVITWLLVGVSRATDRNFFQLNIQRTPLLDRVLTGVGESISWLRSAMS